MLQQHSRRDVAKTPQQAVGVALVVQSHLLCRLLLSMSDNRYWAMGPQVGKAWSDGKTMKQH